MLHLGSFKTATVAAAAVPAAAAQVATVEAAAEALCPSCRFPPQRTS